MFGVSIPELLLVFVLVLIIFGPEKLPEIASTLGKTFGALRKNTDALRREFYNSVYTPADNFQNSITEAARELIVTPEEQEAMAVPDPDCPDTIRAQQEAAAKAAAENSEEEPAEETTDERSS